MGRATKGLMLVMVCAAGLGGCGTTSNLNDPDGKPDIFGGVRRDLEMQLVTDSFRNSAAGDPSLLTTVPLVLVSLVDLPLSAVCDILTLPLTIRVALEKDPPPVQPTSKAAKAVKARTPVSSTPAADKQ